MLERKVKTNPSPLKDHCEILEYRNIIKIKRLKILGNYLLDIEADGSCEINISFTLDTFSLGLLCALTIKLCC